MPSTSNDALQTVAQANPTYVYVSAFSDELQRAGVHNVVICPGSRSTPLALALVEQPGLRAWLHVDERSAAFFALGMAKRQRAPVALLCTSGTAAANFLPALVEARLSHVPLLVLTADRPPELRDCGAPQAIDQNRLYGSHVKWFVEVALPEANNAALRYIRTLANRAAALAHAVPAGPVHLNFPLREPLTPEPLADQPLPPAAERDEIAWYGRAGNAPYVAVNDTPLASASAATIEALAERLSTLRHGLLIAGPDYAPALSSPLLRLAELLGYPILADPLSQLRCDEQESHHVLTSYDAFLRSTPFMASMEPHYVLRFGAMPTSKPLLLYLKRYPHCPQIVIDGHNGWDEPTGLASDLIHADPAAFCHDLLAALEKRVRVEDSHKVENSGEDWLAAWQHADSVTRQTLQRTIGEFKPLFEGRVFTELAELLPDGATLFVGNSMPVRDMDTFFWPGPRRIRIMGNRGANGIDGVVSSALGACAAADRDERTVLVIGDLSFFHDLNGLLAARLHRLNLTVVLVNNDGGGIFSFLPQAAYPEHFEELFGTPTGLDFAPGVRMYGGTFQRVTSWEAFRAALKQGLANDGLHVVEVPTERGSNVTMHRELWQAVGNALNREK